MIGDNLRDGESGNLMTEIFRNFDEFLKDFMNFCCLMVLHMNPTLN